MITRPPRMHRLLRYGLLLSMFRGLCVCVSVGHNHQLCLSGLTNRDAVWGVDFGWGQGTVFYVEAQISQGE